VGSLACALTRAIVRNHGRPASSLRVIMLCRRSHRAYDRAPATETAATVRALLRIARDSSAFAISVGETTVGYLARREWVTERQLEHHALAVVVDNERLVDLRAAGGGVFDAAATSEQVPEFVAGHRGALRRCVTLLLRGDSAELQLLPGAGLGPRQVRP
jgi:hypothetical protein